MSWAAAQQGMCEAGFLVDSQWAMQWRQIKSVQHFCQFLIPHPRRQIYSWEHGQDNLPQHLRMCLQGGDSASLLERKSQTAQTSHGNQITQQRGWQEAGGRGGEEIKGMSLAFIWLRTFFLLIGKCIGVGSERFPAVSAPLLLRFLCKFVPVLHHLFTMPWPLLAVMSIICF